MPINTYPDSTTMWLVGKDGKATKLDELKPEVVVSDALPETTTRLYLPKTEVLQFRIELEKKSKRWIARWVQHLNGGHFEREREWRKTYARCMYYAWHGRTEKIRKKNRARTARLMHKAKRRWGVFPYTPYVPHAPYTMKREG